MLSAGISFQIGADNGQTMTISIGNHALDERFGAKHDFKRC